MQKLGQESIQNHFQITTAGAFYTEKGKDTDPEPMLCKTQVQAWRDSGGCCTAEVAQSYLGLLMTLTNQILEALLQMTCPWAWLLLWDLSLLQLTQQNDIGNIHVSKPAALLAGVQGTEQTTLQAMKLLGTHVSRELPRSPKSKSHTTGLSMSHLHTLSNHNRNSSNYIMKLWKFTLRKLSKVH